MSEPNIRRSVVFEVKIGADSPEELARALDTIARQARIEGFGNGNGASGGFGSGWTYTYSHDPSITHDSYFEAIERWRNERKP